MWLGSIDITTWSFGWRVIWIVSRVSELPPLVATITFSWPARSVPGTVPGTRHAAATVRQRTSASLTA